MYRSSKTFSAALVRTLSIAALGVAISAIGLGTQTADAQRFGLGTGVRSGGGFQLTIDGSGVRFGVNPGFGRPGLGRPGFGRPGFGRPGFGRPGFGRPGGPGHHGPDHGFAPNFIGETGTVSIAQANRRQWHRVNLHRSYRNPVVVLGPLTSNGAQPATVRVRGVGANGFEVKIAEWSYLDGAHAAETVGYMVVESGRHELAGGVTLVAGTSTGIDQDWTRVRYGGRFDSRPVVLTTVAGARGGLPVVARLRNVNRQGFGLRVQKEEGANELVRAPRRINWVAIEQAPRGPNGRSYIVETTGNAVTNNPFRIRVPRNLQGQPVFLAAIQSFAGTDTAGLRYRARPRALAIRIEEETSQDRETSHAAERVGYAVFTAGFLETSTPHVTSTGPRPGPQGPGAGRPAGPRGPRGLPGGGRRAGR